VNGVGKPCAGEPHARFERGPLGTAGDDVEDTKKDQSDDPSLGHRQSSMSSIAQPAAYLTEMTQPTTATGNESAVASGGGSAVRMRRAPGGRPARLNLRLTEEEERQIRQRAEGCGLSAPRYLIEAGLSRSASDAADRRRVEWDLGQARVVLKAAGNNLNQLAKWANANHALPAHIEAALGEVQRAIEVIEDCAKVVTLEFAPER
jgi:uncharacterized protein (DUF1778 family)